jgi:ketopantoate reductase
MYNANGAVTWEYDPDVLKWRWKKLVYNAAFSSIAALTGLDTGAMRMSRFVVEDLVRPAMLEIMAVAKAAGVRLPEDIHETFIRIDPAEKRYLPSMGVDVKKVSSVFLFRKVMQSSHIIALVDGLLMA